MESYQFFVIIGHIWMVGSILSDSVVAIIIMFLMGLVSLLLGFYATYLEK